MFPGILRVTARRRIAAIAIVLALPVVGLILLRWEGGIERRVSVVEPGRILRGAWQGPGPLLQLIRRERIRTVVTLTAINADDPKYVDQERAIRKAGVDWVLIPMKGSRATLEQMAEAADLVADPARQPVFFHCVGGHHRSSLVQAAYRIRHQGWTAKAAWDEVAALPWARPEAPADLGDRGLIEAFAEAYRHEARKDPRNEASTAPMAAPRDHADGDDRGRVPPVAMGGR